MATNFAFQPTSSDQTTFAIRTQANFGTLETGVYDVLRTTQGALTQDENTVESPEYSTTGLFPLDLAVLDRRSNFTHNGVYSAGTWDSIFKATLFPTNTWTGSNNANVAFVDTGATISDAGTNGVYSAPSILVDFSGANTYTPAAGITPGNVVQLRVKDQPWLTRSYVVAAATGAPGATDVTLVPLSQTAGWQTLAAPLVTVEPIELIVTGAISPTVTITPQANTKQAQLVNTDAGSGNAWAQMQVGEWVSLRGGPLANISAGNTGKFRIVTINSPTDIIVERFDGLGAFTAQANVGAYIDTGAYIDAGNATCALSVVEKEGVSGQYKYGQDHVITSLTHGITQGQAATIDLVAPGTGVTVPQPDATVALHAGEYTPFSTQVMTKVDIKAVVISGAGGFAQSATLTYNNNLADPSALGYPGPAAFTPQRRSLSWNLAFLKSGNERIVQQQNGTEVALDVVLEDAVGGGYIHTASRARYQSISDPSPATQTNRIETANFLTLESNVTGAPSYRLTSFLI